MKKNILLLMAVGVMGCGYSINTELIYKPTAFWDGAKPSLTDKVNSYGDGKVDEVCLIRLFSYTSPDSTVKKYFECVRSPNKQSLSEVADYYLNKIF